MDTALVVFTEARAQDLRLSYSRYLAPRRLLARVLDVEHRALDVLQRQDQVPGCFGAQFGGYTNASCAVCQLQAACLTRTTADTLPKVEADVGLDARAQARALDTGLTAVGLMHSLRAALLEPVTTDWLKEPLLKHGHGRRPVTDVSMYRYRRPRKPSVLAFAALFGAQAAETAWPPHPQKVSHRYGTNIEHTYALHRLALVPQRLTYGSPTWKLRVRRDRLRLPELTWLPDGTRLRVVRAKELVEVVVFSDRLEWRGQVFPTLYEVVAAVSGRIEYRQSAPTKTGKGTRHMPKHSARKFFLPAFKAIQALAHVILEERFAARTRQRKIDDRRFGELKP